MNHFLRIGLPGEGRRASIALAVRQYLDAYPLSPGDCLVQLFGIQSGTAGGFDNETQVVALIQDP